LVEKVINSANNNSNSRSNSYEKIKNEYDKAKKESCGLSGEIFDTTNEYVKMEEEYM
jgi:hypothetical protein